MRLSELTTVKRLFAGVAVAALALTLVACSDEKKETASTTPDAAQTTADTTKTTDTATATKVETATAETAKTETVKTETAQADTAKTDTAKTETTKTETTKTETATPAAAAKVELPVSEGDIDVAKLMAPGPLPEMSIGEANAPVTIVEYMSMTCPHCAHFHNTTFDAIKAKYVETGKVRFILREFPFDPRAAAAFMLARCAPEGQYFPMVSMLFKQQEQWAAAKDGREALLQMSKLAGFTQESFQACLTNQKLLDDVNAVMQKGAKDFDVASTPTFIVNGKRYSGDMSVDTMSALIDSML
ncbi:DsbA family protein [Pararhizobium sp.]|uniref:DsbA family protein n=1 Tax=Pararhizobium sp. TaxID=1977563 RepID=UPI002727BDFF|nr:DsbA family protein [Pararhizobium sp.]MDO9415800.1 DsbA family protein [Pararhizobium sp.]